MQLVDHLPNGRTRRGKHTFARVAGLYEIHSRRQCRRRFTLETQLRFIGDEAHKLISRTHRPSTIEFQSKT